MTDKEKAIRKIIYSIMLPIVANRKQALKLAEKHNVSAADILEYLLKQNQNV